MASSYKVRKTADHSVESLARVLRALEEAERVNRHLQPQRKRIQQPATDAIKPPSTAALLASGSHGNWDVAIDESSRPRKWFAEVRGPSFYFHFQIPKLEVVHDWLQFLDNTLRRTKPKHAAGKTAIHESGTCKELRIGTFLGKGVAIVSDTEFADRCFFLVAESVDSFSSCLRIPVAGQDMVALRDALRQVDEDLNGG